jgi:transposase
MGEPSRRTNISVAFHQSGLYGRVARRKPLLSKRQMTARLEFAKRHLKTLRSDSLHTAKTTQECLRDKSLNVLECPSQNPDLNPIKHLWRYLKIAVQWHSPSNLTELEGICRAERDILSKCRCAKLVSCYANRLEAVITTKGASTKYCVYDFRHTYSLHGFSELFLFSTM